MHRRVAASLTLPLLACLACRATPPEYGRALEEGADALIPLGPHEPWPDLTEAWQNREDVMGPLERSIAWTRRPQAESFFPIAGIDHARALASLERFRELLIESRDKVEFREALEDEFVVYKSAGWDGRGGGVLFTAYCTPIVPGSLTPDDVYRFPLYALPDDLEKAADGTILGWRTPQGLSSYPSRRAIETGELLANRGLELVWLRDPIDAYLAHVNGSAFIRLITGELYRLGYAGKNGRPYSSLGRELILDGELEEGEVSLAGIRAWAAERPEAIVLEYLHRNESYVFFTPIDANPRGSLNVEVTAKRSLATDKQLFPRGAIVFVDCELAAGVPFRRTMFDQDTGGAIRTAGRADIYLGIGEDAEQAAGGVKAAGQLYYLFLDPRSSTAP